MENYTTSLVNWGPLGVGLAAAIIAAMAWIKLAKPRLTQNHFLATVGSIGAILAAVTTFGSVYASFETQGPLVQYLAACLFGMLPVFALALWVANRKFMAGVAYVISGLTSAAFFLILFDQAQMSAANVADGTHKRQAIATADLSETLALTLLKDQQAARRQFEERERALSAARAEITAAQREIAEGVDSSLSEKLTQVEALIGLPDNAGPGLDKITASMLVAAQTRNSLRPDGRMGPQTREALRRERLSIIGRASSATQRAEQRLAAAKKMAETARTEVLSAEKRLAELRDKTSTVTAGAIASRSSVTQAPLDSSFWNAFDQLVQFILYPITAITGAKVSLENMLTAAALFMGFLLDALGRLLAPAKDAGRRWDWKWPGLRPGLRRAVETLVDGGPRALPKPEPKPASAPPPRPVAADPPAKGKKRKQAELDPVRYVPMTAIAEALSRAIAVKTAQETGNVVQAPFWRRQHAPKRGSKARDRPARA